MIFLFIIESYMIWYTSYIGIDNHSKGTRCQFSSHPKYLISRIGNCPFKSEWIFSVSDNVYSSLTKKEERDSFNNDDNNNNNTIKTAADLTAANNQEFAAPAKQKKKKKKRVEGQNCCPVLFTALTISQVEIKERCKATSIFKKSTARL